MSADFQSQRRWLIAAIVLLAALFLLVIAALVRSIRYQDESPQVGDRAPAAELAYCAPGDTGLCVVSFGQAVDGEMLVNLQIPRPNYTRFDLTIDRYGVESSYRCRTIKGLSTGMACTGPSQVPGEILQFRLISRADGSLLAEGKFAIIGIALASPEPVASQTLEATETETPPDSYPNPFDNPTAYP